MQQPLTVKNLKTWNRQQSGSSYREQVKRTRDYVYGQERLHPQGTLATTTLTPPAAATNRNGLIGGNKNGLTQLYVAAAAKQHPGKDT